MNSYYEYDNGYESSNLTPVFISLKIPLWTKGHQGEGVMSNHMLASVGMRNP